MWLCNKFWDVNVKGCVPEVTPVDASSCMFKIIDPHDGLSTCRYQLALSSAQSESAILTHSLSSTPSAPPSHLATPSALFAMILSVQEAPVCSSPAKLHFVTEPPSNLAKETETQEMACGIRNDATPFSLKPIKSSVNYQVLSASRPICNIIKPT